MKLLTTTKVSIINGLILLGLTLLAYFNVVKFDMIFSYNWHKILHILGAILFMGNMIIGPVWFFYAYYSKNVELLKFASKLLQLTDLYLTIPGAALTVLNGLFLASMYGGIQNAPWLFTSMLMLFAMWGLSIPLIFLQEKMYKTIDQEPENYEKLDKIMLNWAILGSAVMIPPTYIFYLMVTKGV